MFLSKNHVLGHELCEFLGMSTSVISIYRKERENEGDFRTVSKLAGSVFIDLNSQYLSVGLSVSYDDRKKAAFTDLSNKLPLSFLKEMYELQPKDLHIIGGKEVKLKNVRFWEFEDSFIAKMTPKNKTKNVVTCILTDEEISSCLDKKQIAGYIYLSAGTKEKPSRNFAWYFV